jgi:bifunctional non-homologous end joining protein LigD
MGDLTAYAAKRDFGKTPEPAAEPTGERRGKAVFVVQKHDATRLHWDFRLEHEGVLKSWAVTNEPSLDPSIKRLAVRTEDHPLAYASFEGAIPEGSYGAGLVEIWDKGEWVPMIEPEAGFEKGHLEFGLNGARMGGRWHLVRLKGDRRARAGAAPRENWLLIKAADEFARADPERPAGAQAATTPGSRAAKAARARDEASAATPGRMPFALATSVAHTPSGEGWLHEVKLDGYRIQASLSKGEVRLDTRNGLDWTHRFPAVADALRRLSERKPGRHVVDGEIVVEDEQGRSDFAALQKALKTGADPARFAYWAFDALLIDGEDIRSRPLVERKRRLQALLAGAGPVLRYSEDFTEDGPLLERHACRLGLEGVVSKRAADPYPEGRTPSWVKSKCRNSQEFIVCGFTRQNGTRGPLGALLVAVQEDGKLRHAGRVGTGFDGADAEELMALLKPRIQARSPLEKPPHDGRGRDVTWVRPGIVVEVSFAAWTGHGLIRHGAFKGIREDKTDDVVLKDADAAGKAGPAHERQEAAMVEKPIKDAVLSPKARLRAMRESAASERGDDGPVKLSHPEKALWPSLGVTKRRLADYYAAIWPRIAPHLVGRPLALLRCPDGVGGPSFFQKHARSEIEGLARTLPDGEEAIVVSELDDLITLVQFSALELHPWGATIDAPEACDQIILDLDPGEGVEWSAVKAGALTLKAMMEADGLTSFVKLSGGKGIHVVAPLWEKADWDAARAYAKSLAQRAAKAEPQRYVASMAKQARTGKIFIDYLRNGQGSTAVAPYSTRARPGGGVAMPVSWGDLHDVKGPEAWSIATIDAKAILASPDPWSDFRMTKNALPAP